MNRKLIPVLSLLTLSLGAQAAAPQPIGRADLTFSMIGTDKTLSAEVLAGSASETFFGLVLISLSNQQLHFAGLPPILDSHVVFGCGKATGMLTIKVEQRPRPFDLYFQAAALMQDQLVVSKIVKVQATVGPLAQPPAAVDQPIVNARKVAPVATEPPAQPAADAIQPYPANPTLAHAAKVAPVAAEPAPMPIAN
ncbi:MAG TPA: hypothetical protein VK348_13670 [Planctomycetota bacterium]|nr:hypothetical protein [Planctomycetota bacterium]